MLRQYVSNTTGRVNVANSLFRIWLSWFWLLVSILTRGMLSFGGVKLNGLFDVIDSAKGEECIPQTWDMFHEKWEIFVLIPLQAPNNIIRWGFMVIFWNFSGVPFVSFLNKHWILIHWFEHDQSYVYSVVYMASHDPSTYRFSTGGYIFIYTVLCTAYYMYVPSPSSMNTFSLRRLGQLGYSHGTKEPL